MEDSLNKKPLTDSEMEELQDDISKQLSEPKKPYLPSSSLSSLSSSKPPLGPVPLLLKQPNNIASLHTSIEAVSAATDNSEEDKNVALNDASSDHDHHETSNLETKQQEPTKASDPSDDRKLKRVMSNRMSAHRSRLRKLEHVANLERQCVQLKNQIGLLQPQVEAFANLKHLLMLEQTVLRQRIEALENERLVKQAEIERNQAEVHRLREIEKRQREEQAQAMMAYANWDAVPNNQQMFNRNIPTQGFQNIEGTSRMEVDEQAVYLNSPSSMNELEAIVNPPKLSDNKTNPEFRFYF